MSLLTFGDVQNSRIPGMLGLNPTDPRLLQWTNQAVYRLLLKGRYWGSYGVYKICVSGSSITLPREIATIEAVQLNGVYSAPHDQWFEFIEARSSVCWGEDWSFGCCGWNEANAQGRYCTFADIIGTDKKLALACDQLADVGKQVLVLGYDQNGNWIRSLQNGVMADGELVAYSQGAGTQTVNYFTTLTAMQLPANMTGQSYCYEHSTTTNANRLIGQYAYNDTRPSWARYQFPSLRFLDQLNPAQSATSPLTPAQLATRANPFAPASCTRPNVMVKAMCKREFIPVATANDYLLLGCLPAIEIMVEALKKAEDVDSATDKIQIRAVGEAAAAQKLDEELDHYLGAGRRQVLNFMGSSNSGFDPVFNPL